MSVKDDLTTLVALQARELEVVRIDGEIAEVERGRAAARAEIEAAEGFVEAAEVDLEAARAAAKRLDVDLKAAEDKVAKFKDQMLAVKTNQQLWAIQEEIGHAEAGVGAVETKILEHMEKADALEDVIGTKKTDLTAATARVNAAVAVADQRESELVAERKGIEAEIADLRQLVPGDLMKKYESIKAMRGGVAVAEALDEICMVCNFKVRPQLYVETLNFSDIMKCENCGRILYVAEPLGMTPPPAPAADAMAAGEPVPEAGSAAAESAPTAAGSAAADGAI